MDTAYGKFTESPPWRAYWISFLSSNVSWSRRSIIIEGRISAMSRSLAMRRSLLSLEAFLSSSTRAASAALETSPTASRSSGDIEKIGPVTVITPMRFPSES